ncbi:hypothetical protein [Winogradskyella sp. PC D3.3]
MKNLLKLKTMFILLLCVSLFTCSDDDSANDETPNNDSISYANFNISGSITNGNYEFRDTGADDEFNTFGYFLNADEDPDISEDQIQVYIGKSYTDSNFLLVAPTATGTYNFSYQGGANDFDISIILSSLEDNYIVKSVSVIISELEINGSSVTHCKGTFTGTFYRNNLVESDVHQINGEFEINN